MAYEVLANMRRGDVMLPASQFIMVAEDLGLVREIDLCVISKALQQAPAHIELFLNISLLSFHDHNFGGDLLRLVQLVPSTFDDQDDTGCRCWTG